MNESYVYFQLFIYVKYLNKCKSKKSICETYIYICIQVNIYTYVYTYTIYIYIHMVLYSIYINVYTRKMVQ